MYVLKGFAVNSALVNNSPGVISTIGELSTQASTYSREKGYYNSTAAAGLQLVTFMVKNNDTALAAVTNISDHVLTVAKKVYDYSSSIGGEIFNDELVNLLTDYFVSSGNNSSNTFVSGPIINDGVRWMPEWISWINSGISGLGTNSMKIWFVDEAFRSQYDEYEIVVIPPTATLRDFFRPATEVATMLTALTRSQITARVNTAKGNNPPTVIRTEEYDYVNPLNQAQKYKTTWDLLVYGQAGNNVDSVKDAITSHVLALTATGTPVYDRDDWLVIIPDLFRRTEFVMIPFWDQLAIPELSVQSGIYSPDISPSRAVALIKSVASSYSPTHIDNFASIMAHPYKSLQIGIIGGAENRDNKFKLRQMFDDVIAVPTSSLDFSRMKQATKDFLLLLNTLLPVAETMTRFSTIPDGFTRLIRDNHVYAVFSFGNVNYLVAGKVDFTNVIPGP